MASKLSDGAKDLGLFHKIPKTWIRKRKKLKI